MKKEFISCFQLDRKTLFNIEYYTLGHNERPYFSTSADHFNQPKTDFDFCGQCQEEILQNFPEALNFWIKWDKKHLYNLTQEEYDQMILDLETLKQTYNYLYIDFEEKCTKDHFSFYELKEFSKQKVKKNLEKRCKK